ncbi:MAG: alpha/beta hydrolase [Bacteroidales bacterium]|jgi:proline iminopeptidase|nr:alpha/beta hydrolase [Bacteroidales bacterium]MDX9927000.1 alpha/beta hydrolase [Bacteroidales bacterium]HNX83753.1 alpha/beta hydrolase [Bacteroidales bacterium]HOC47569.1 alpha/beta hydrolase [Bacteroidales bacterium]HPS97378.1 alpha/beta hydrolase [Bacteroidales bacterium]
MKKSLLFLSALLLGVVVCAQERHIITTDGVDLYVNVKGEGTPCLYLHGGPGSGSYWLEKFAGDSLEKHFRMIYLDQRGVGRSSSPADGNYSMDRMVKDFEEVREALGISRWITLGHSFGGLLQMGYSLRHPPAVEAMVMINCSLNMGLNYKTSWCPKACELLGITDRSYFVDESIPLHVRWDSLITALNSSDMMWKMGFASREEMNIMNSTYGELPSWNGDFSEAAMRMDDYGEDFTEATAKVNMPVLFIYSTRDWMIGPEHYKTAQFPEMMLVSIDAAHMPFFGDNAAVMKAISTFRKRYRL